VTDRRVTVVLTFHVKREHCRARRSGGEGTQIMARKLSTWRIRAELEALDVDPSWMTDTHETYTVGDSVIITTADRATFIGEISSVTDTRIYVHVKR
jgi:hypothetical protein